MNKVVLGALVITGLLSGCNDKETKETIKVVEVEVEVKVEVEVPVPGISEVSATPHVDFQPEYSDDVRATITERVAAFKKAKLNTHYRDAYNYDSKGSYLGYGMFGRSCSDAVRDGRRLNRVGVMEFETPNDGYQTSPVLSAQCGLQEYFKQNRTYDDIVQAYVTDLLDSQNAQGGFEYPYHYNYRGEKYKPGWVSGMAQGQALSFLTRVLQDNDLPELYDSAQRAFEFMITPVAEGGTMSTLADIDASLADYIFFEEVVSKGQSQSHILNGYIFSILGLYDWWQMDPDATEGTHYKAKLYYESAVKSLIKVLPYYDAIGFSLYDIWHITDETKPIKVAWYSYHYAHLYLLEGMLGITGDAHIGNMLRRWSADVDQYPVYKKD